MSLSDPATAIAAARERIAPFVHRTPVLTSRRVDAIAGASLVFKCENFQRGGAFKARGAFNAVMSLSDDEAAGGVCTHSSGNHGAALALAAQTRAIPCHVVIPANTAGAKRAAIDGYGAIIHVCEPTMAAREALAAQVMAETGAVFVHPYDNDVVIAGAATAAAELIEQAPDLDIIVAPIGGGGLISGTSLSARAFGHGVAVIGAEPAGADDAARSFVARQVIPQTNPQTIADGLRASLSERTLRYMLRGVAEVVTAPEFAIVDAMRLVWSAMKILIEPSSAVPLAAMLESRKPFAGRRVGVILTGGNVDLDHLPW
ncbi:MAG TPA: pyridoxal-phosphate dependent enzyme [Caulobacteraceae bacterium]|nr:pyridoxal-phosphate dependent enzyme [Caulobacteraceae bacterium]